MAEVNPIQVEKHLKGLDYPTSKDNLVKHAQQQGADQNIMDALQKLPDETFNKPTDVTKAIGEINRESR